MTTLLKTTKTKTPDGSIIIDRIIEFNSGKVFTIREAPQGTEPPSDNQGLTKREAYALYVEAKEAGII